MKRTAHDLVDKYELAFVKKQISYWYSQRTRTRIEFTESVEYCLKSHYSKRTSSKHS